MSNVNRYNEIDNVKNQIVNIALLFGTSLGFIALMVSLSNYISEGIKPSNMIDIAVFIILALTTIFRTKAHFKVKSLIIISGIIALVFNDTYKWGIFSDNLILFILLPFIAFLAFGFYKSILLYASSLIGIIVIGYLQISGCLETNPNLVNRNLMVESWIINILLLTIVAFIIIIMVKLFTSTFVNLLDNLKKRNLDLTQSEQNYREIFNASSDAIFIHDMNGKILDVNDSMLKMYEYKRNELPQLNLPNLSSGKDNYTIDVASKYMQEAMETGEKVFDWQAKKKSGEYFWVEVALKKTKILNDERILGVVRDIDEKKTNALQLALYRTHLEDLVKERTIKLEEANEDLMTTNEELHSHRTELQSTLEKLQKTQTQLIQSEKMASLGTLSAGVAHEINNPLNFIKGGLVALESYFEENSKNGNEDISVILNAINVGVNRAAEIVLSLNHFSRKADAEMEACSIHSIIDNCLLVLNNQMKKKLDVLKNYSSIEPVINGNDGKLHQALLNILTNAEQAIEENGIIEIKTEIIGNKFVFSISDNGIGISEENMLKITEPFFTTKDPGKGTGLGLSIAYNIITEHKGSIDFKSKQNEGTTVTIKLPINKNLHIQ